jgi:acyl-CoA reductase-like NAD-dependent aldehyde dehydrogenase
VSILELMIGGVRRPASDGGTFDVIEPATGKVMATVAKATAQDVSDAVAAAHRGFTDGAWPRMSPTQRGRILMRAANIMRDRMTELTELESRNGGKPWGNAEWEVGNCADLLEYYGGAADKLMGEVAPIEKPGLAVVLREPVGPCALVVPWNFPLVLTGRKVAPALAAGNTIVIKPASYTPLTALALGEILIEAGVPADAVSVVPGPGSLVGDALCADPRIAKVSFTGSPETGAAVMARAARNIPRFSMELGGKSAMVIFADADLDAAISGIPGATFDNAGQDCCSRSRILIEASVFDDVVARIAGTLDAMKVGAPADRSIDMGPMISASQRQNALNYLDIGRADGGEVVCGGTVVSDGELSDGFFMRPALMTGVSNTARIAQEEIFGPVAVAIPFHSEDEAVALANDSIFGLSGSLFTRNFGRAMRVSKAIRTGILSVNSNSSAHTQAAFGGFKQSGLGRELGMGAFEAYTETRAIYFNSQS